MCAEDWDDYDYRTRDIPKCKACLGVPGWTCNCWCECGELLDTNSRCPVCDVENDIDDDPE